MIRCPDCGKQFQLIPSRTKLNTDIFYNTFDYDHATTEVDVISLCPFCDKSLRIELTYEIHLKREEVW